MDIYEIRRINLLTLINELGSAVNVSEACDISPSYISQAKSSKSDTKNIGNIIARKLEKGTNKPHGWLDTLHTDKAAINNQLTIDNELFIAVFAYIEGNIQREFNNLPAEQQAGAFYKLCQLFNDASGRKLDASTIKNLALPI